MVSATPESPYEQRAAVAARRVRELGERRRELAAYAADADDAGRLERLRGRQRAAESAAMHAAEADWRVRVAYRRAAEAHERAAAAHERAADQGVGDVAAHREAAARDRQAAAEDRIAAASPSPILGHHGESAWVSSTDDPTLTRFNPTGTNDLRIDITR